MQIGIMIEGQLGLNWLRWGRMLTAVEDFGFQSLFRSDHYVGGSPPDQDQLELWVSLTYAADHTERIEFGPLVTPITFRHPTITARAAAAVDDLSGGRLVLGMGTGWQEREHEVFGIPFHDFATRFDMLQEGLEVVTRLFNRDDPVTYRGEHYQLDEAILLPRPMRAGGPPVLVGGNGPQRTLPLVARYADEWNALAAPRDLFQERNALLDDLLREEGRAPGAVKRSMMTATVFGADDAALRDKLAERSARAGRELTVAALQERGFIAGTPAQWVDQLAAYADAGLERIMLQWLDLDDIDGLETIAKTVLPHFAE